MDGLIKRKKCEKNGFTIIELILVLAVLGILAVVAIPSLFDVSLFQAKEKSSDAVLSSVRTGIALFASSEISTGNQLNYPVLLETEDIPDGTFASLETPLFDRVLKNGVLANWVKLDDDCYAYDENFNGNFDDGSDPEYQYYTSTGKFELVDNCKVIVGGGGDDDEGEEEECLTAETIVMKADESGKKLIPTALWKIKVGDLILDGDGYLSKVNGWLHRFLPEQEVELVIFRDMSGKELMSVTKKHLIFDLSNDAIFADEFVGKPYAYIRSIYGDSIKIRAEIKKRSTAFLLSPNTESGTIAVFSKHIASKENIEQLSGIKVSNYAHFKSHTVAHWYITAKKQLGIELTGRWKSRGYEGQLLGVFKTLGLAE